MREVQKPCQVGQNLREKLDAWNILYGNPPHTKNIKSIEVYTEVYCPVHGHLVPVMDECDGCLHFRGIVATRAKRLKNFKLSVQCDATEE
jgi:hypothetical protein